MRRAFILSVVAAIYANLCITLPAQAEENGVSDCGQAVTDKEILDCTVADFDAADKALNAAYAEAVKAAREFDASVDKDSALYGELDALKKAQRAWIVYRDAQCEYEGFAARGGSLENVFYVSCQADLTRLQTKRLEDLYNGK